MASPIANSVAARRRLQEGNTGDLPLLGAVPARQQGVNTVEVTGGQWLLDHLHDAIGGVYSHKAAAIDMDMDKGLLSRQLNGDGHLSLLRVGCIQSPEVHVSWAERILGRFGRNDKAARIERAMQLIEQGKAMLAAEVTR